VGYWWRGSFLLHTNQNIVLEKIEEGLGLETNSIAMQSDHQKALSREGEAELFLLYLLDSGPSDEFHGTITTDCIVT
jgi:hypothetical protein